MNPYNALLYGSLQRLGVDTQDATFATIFGKRPDIVHIHWPEYLFSAGNTTRALLNAGAFVIAILWLTARKVKIVWTVHNLTAHEEQHPRLEQRMWRFFIRRVDACISLTPAGHAAVCDRYPELTSVPAYVIPHGHYLDVYPDDISRGDARRILGLQEQATVCFLGVVRRYKGVPDLIRAFGAVDEPTWRLVIAGKVHEDVADLLHRATSSDHRVRLHPGFVPDEQVQVYLRAADLVVLPYRDILNSGSAILALSFGARILIPSRGAGADLAEFIGTDWVRTYDGDLTPAILEEAMAWALNPPLTPVPLDRLAWEEIAEATNAAFEAISLQPHRSRAGARRQRRRPARRFVSLREAG